MSDPRDAQQPRSTGKGLARVEALVTDVGDKLGAALEVHGEVLKGMRRDILRVEQRQENMEMRQGERDIQASETRAKLSIMEETLTAAVRDLKELQTTTAVHAGAAAAETVAPLVTQQVREGLKPKRPWLDLGLKGSVAGGVILVATHPEVIPIVGQVLEPIGKWLQTIKASGS